MTTLTGINPSQENIKTYSRVETRPPLLFLCKAGRDFFCLSYNWCNFLDSGINFILIPKPRNTISPLTSQVIKHNSDGHCGQWWCGSSQSSQCINNKLRRGVGLKQDYWKKSRLPFSSFLAFLSSLLLIIIRYL